MFRKESTLALPPFSSSVLGSTVPWTSSPSLTARAGNPKRADRLHEPVEGFQCSGVLVGYQHDQAVDIDADPQTPKCSVNDHFGRTRVTENSGCPPAKRHWWALSNLHSGIDVCSKCHQAASVRRHDPAGLGRGSSQGILDLDDHLFS